MGEEHRKVPRRSGQAAVRSLEDSPALCVQQGAGHRRSRHRAADAGPGAVPRLPVQTSQR